ncbi:unnamed protein product [Pleuronectes platessa]|uniref:Uncharacterized protein n=1 Tax=Pleuronectes platessa TaxID=8262 RepID=A0A9N7YLH1_PLEPL|nr:unnamed protein product [Pleuronectes platessa]
MVCIISTTKECPQQPTTILQQLPVTMMPPGCAPSIRPGGPVKEERNTKKLRGRMKYMRKETVTFWGRSESGGRSRICLFYFNITLWS